MHSEGEHTEARNTHTRADTRAAKGQGTHCHTHCLKCHTQASLGVWRAEGSCQVGGRFVPPDTACRICRGESARTPTHSERLSTQSLNSPSMAGAKKHTPSSLDATVKVLWMKSRCCVGEKKKEKTLWRYQETIKKLKQTHVF